MSIQNSIDTIANRTRDLPAGSAVPQPNAPPRAPAYTGEKVKFQAYFDLMALQYTFSHSVIIVAVLPKFTPLVALYKG